MSTYYTYTLVTSTPFNEESLFALIARESNMGFRYLVNTDFVDVWEKLINMTTEEAVAKVLQDNNKEEKDFNYPLGLTFIYNRCPAEPISGVLTISNKNDIEVSLFSLGSWYKKFPYDRHGYEKNDSGRTMRLLLELCEDLSVTDIKMEVDY